MNWWESLGLSGQIYFCIAVAATVMLLLQSIFMFFGGGDDADTDAGSDGSFDGEGLHLFSIRGIVAFFAIGGWTGVIMTQSSAPTWLTIIISLVAGAAALFVIALIMKAMVKMQSNGTISLNENVGKVATVYLRVPAHGKGSGKITLDLSGRFSEVDAVSLNEQEYTVGENVKIVGVLGDSFIVDKIAEEK